MTENLPSESLPQETTPPTDEASRERRHRTPSSGGWIVGAILVLIGIIFLAQNLTTFRLDNWWALFILIPALGSLGAAWRAYQSEGRLSRTARGPLIGGLILLLITTIFLFNLDWGRMWPAFLIIVGVGMLVSAL